MTEFFFTTSECCLLLIIANGLNSSIVNSSFLSFFAMRLILVPVPYGIDLQNSHPIDDFSWLHHIPILQFN